MSWFDPEKMVKSLISSLGVSPEDFIGFIVMARTEFLEMRADRLAFKPASVKAYQELTGRMERLETKLDKVLALCEFNLLPVEPLTECENERPNGIHPPIAG